MILTLEKRRSTDTSTGPGNFNQRIHMECDSENAVIHTLMISIPHIIAKTDAKKAWANR